MASDGANRDAVVWREASTEARGVLLEVMEWHLTESRWHQVRHIVGGMGDAVAAADVQSLWGTVTQLEQLGPLRVATRLGDTPKKPAPADVRERINELIDAVVPPVSPGPGDRSGSEQDSGHERGTPAH